MFNSIKKFIPVAALSLITTGAFAEVVNLKSLDGGTTLSGDLVEFDGNNYVIKTLVGEMSVDALLVTCEGAACPDIEAEPSNFNISAPSKISDLFDSLLFEFAVEIGGDALTTLNTDGPTMVTLRNELGNDLSNVALYAENTAQSLRNLFEGRANLIATTRPISADENNTFQFAQLGDLTTPEQQRIFALDGLVIVTSKSNPIRAVSEADLARIFSGSITNWNQVGGVDAKINLYVRDKNSGTGFIFNELVMAPVGLNISEQATINDTDSDIAKSVSVDPLGIGIASLSDTGNAKVLAIRGSCGIQVPATPFTIKTEEYPLTRRLYAYTTKREEPANLNRFVEFLDTDAAQATIANSGFVDLGVSYQSNDEQGLRYLSAVIPTDVEMTLGQLREMTANLMAADRLSITYRFALGSSQLDERAIGDIERLAELLSTGDYNNKELLLIGYTDSIGNGGGNTNLSRQRAAEVKAALLSALPSGGVSGLPIQTLGFGEISPLACNDSANGRRINRRVEVWLRDSIITSR